MEEVNSISLFNNLTFGSKYLDKNAPIGEDIEPLHISTICYSNLKLYEKSRQFRDGGIPILDTSMKPLALLESVTDFINLFKGNDLQSQIFIKILASQDQSGRLYYQCQVTRDFVKRIKEIFIMHAKNPKKCQPVNLLRLKLDGEIKLTANTGPGYNLNGTAPFTTFINLNEDLSLESLRSPKGDMTIDFVGERRNDLRLIYDLKINGSLEWKVEEREDQLAIQISSDKLMDSLFKSDETKDFSLVGEDAAEEKCHKVILAGHSDVFKALLQGGMKEVEMAKLELKGIGGEALKHFVKWLYCQEITIKELDCEIALELLQTAHLYQLSRLLMPLEDVILEQGMEWFKPDVIIELYYFLKNLEEFKKLSEFSLRVMLKMGKSIRECDRYKELEAAEANDLVWKLHDLKVE